MGKTYKNGLLKKKKSVLKSKNPYKNGFFFKIRTRTDKSVRVGTLSMSMNVNVCEFNLCKW